MNEKEEVVETKDEKSAESPAEVSPKEDVKKTVVSDKIEASESEKAEVASEIQKAEETMEMLVHDPNAPIITMKKLLEAGVHFGHQTRKWNPKMSKYIYGARNGIYIIDLGKSAEKITEAYLALKKIVDDNGKVLFVGVKPQAKAIVEEQALRSGSFYISNRWLGGTLTNFKTIQSRIRHLKDLEAAEADGEFEKESKKQAALLRKEKEKLAKNLEGIKEMRKAPNALIVVDPQIERIAVLEARKLHIPVFGIADTNSDPDDLDFPIPANDDAVKSIKIVLTVLADAIVESKGGVTEIAYTKDEGEEVTMKDAIRQADKENAERLAAIRKARQERQERYEKLQAQRAAYRQAREESNKEKEVKTGDAVEEVAKDDAKADVKEVKEVAKEAKAKAEPKVSKAKAPKADAKAKEVKADAKAPKAEVKDVKKAEPKVEKAEDKKAEKVDSKEEKKEDK